MTNCEFPKDYYDDATDMTQWTYST